MVNHGGLSGWQRSTLPDSVVSSLLGDIIPSYLSSKSAHTDRRKHRKRWQTHLEPIFRVEEGPLSVGSKWELNCVGQNFSSVVVHDWISAPK